MKIFGLGRHASVSSKGDLRGKLDRPYSRFSASNQGQRYSLPCLSLQIRWDIIFVIDASIFVVPAVAASRTFFGAVTVNSQRAIVKNKMVEIDLQFIFVFPSQFFERGTTELGLTAVSIPTLKFSSSNK
jgi:hypothetical protein